ncbi:MAG: cation:proton antiporter [Planctomycetota bacterium]
MILLALAEVDSANPGVPLARDLMIILLVAALVSTLFAKVKLEAIPGYLLAGALIGPHALGAIQDNHRVEQISDLAVILLMFGIGLHLDAGHMGRGVVHILGVGAMSTVATTLVAWPILLWLGLPAPAALAVAMALAMSSTAIFVRVVSARREMRTIHSRVGLGVSIVQDLATVVVLGLLPLIARWSGAGVPLSTPQDEWYRGLPPALEFLSRAGISIGGIVALVTVGRYVLPAALRAIAATGSSELLIVFSGSVALAAAVGTRVLGFSAEMGAFLAGFLLASTPFRHQLAGQLAPMRDILMAVFFTAVGLNVDARLVVENWGVVVFGSIGLIALKTLSIGLSGWTLGLTPRSALLSGIYLGNAGEFALVALAPAVKMNIVTDDAGALVIAVVIASLILSPMLIGPAHLLGNRMLGWPLASWIDPASLREDAAQRTAKGLASDELKGHVVVAGFGPAGRAVADRLEIAGVTVTVIELNAKVVERQAQMGKRKVVFGDATNTEVLESAGVRTAAAVVITVPDEEAALRATGAVKAMNPGVYVVTRTSFLAGSFRAQQLGADHVTVDEVAVAETLQREVLQRLKARGIVTTPTT